MSLMKQLCTEWLGLKYQDLKSLRIKADYHLDAKGVNTETNGTADSSVKKTTLILTEIEAFDLNEETKKKILNNIDEWKKLTGSKI